jgi:hypothetical protein
VSSGREPASFRRLSQARVNVCWAIRSTDAGSLVLDDDPAQIVRTRLFFALNWMLRR